MTRRQTPLGVQIISALAVVSGVMMVLWGLQVIGTGWGIPILAVGLGEFVLAWGLWETESWAWAIAVVLYGLSALVTAVGLLNGGSGLVPLVVDVVVLAYLLSVREHFQKRRRASV